MSSNEIISTDILLEFLEVALHTNLFYRKLYPEEIFTKKKIYGLSVNISQHPELNDYLKIVLECVKELIQEDRNNVKSVVLQYVDKNKKPIENYVFNLHRLEAYASDNDPYFLKIEEALRSLCLKLSMLDSYLEPLPLDSSFTISIVTNQAAHVALSENLKFSHFPWIADDQTEIEDGLKMMTDIGEEAAAAEVPSLEISEPSVDLSDAPQKLTEGFLSIYQKPMEYIKKELHTLTLKQEMCITQMQLENKKISDVQEDVELNDLFNSIENCQKKLTNIKKEIVTIHERTAKLKKKALKYQQTKQKEALRKEQQQEHEIIVEEHLIRRAENS